MKTFAIASVIALASVATAQLENIPSCALACFITPLSTDGCLSVTDFKCHCQKGASLLSTVQPCVLGACSASDQAATIAAVQKTCNDAGVPIEIPNASSAVASVVSSKAAAASSAAASVSSAAASAVSSLASKVSSGIAGPTSAIPSVSHSASAPPFTGGAPQATKAAGILGAAAIAMLAL